MDVFEHILRQQEETALAMAGKFRPSTIADRFRNIMSGAYQALILSGNLEESPALTARYLDFANLFEEAAGDREAIRQYMGK